MTDWWVYVKLDTALPDDQTTALLAVGAVTIDHVRTHTEIDANVAASTLPLAIAACVTAIREAGVDAPISEIAASSERAHVAELNERYQQKPGT